MKQKMLPSFAFVLLYTVTTSQSQFISGNTTSNGTSTVTIQHSTALSPTTTPSVQDFEHLLVWSVVEYDHNGGLNSRSALISGKVNLSTAFITNLSTAVLGEDLSEFWTLTPDFPRNRLFYSDYHQNYFGIYNVDDGSHRKIFEGLSYGIDGIAVDWITGNVYWTDIDIHWIMVADKSLEYFSALIPIESYSPSKIVVQPSKNLLIWTEVSVSSTKILRSDLGGGNITVLHNLTDTSLIDELLIDTIENKLYWTERSTNLFFTRAQLCSIDLDHPQLITTLYQALFDTFEGITTVENWIFITSSLSRSILAYDKQTSDTKTVVRHLTNTGLRDVSAYGSYLQPRSRQSQLAHPCFEHSCDHICLVNSTGGAFCVCANGYGLQEDGKSCGITILEDNFILGLDSAHERIYQISLSNKNDYYALPIASTGSVVSIDYDPTSKMIYWAEVDSDVVMRSHLNGSSTEIFLHHINAFSIAVDPVSRNLYAVDSSSDSIVVASLDLPNVTSTLHVEDIFQVWKLVISQSLRKIFWTDWGPSEGTGMIESINLDGTGRQMIANDSVLPYALAVDEQTSTLFWSESSIIVWMNLNTQQQGRYHSALFDRLGSRFLSGLFVHSGFIYIADLFQPTLHRVSVATILSNSHNGGNDLEKIGPTYFYTLEEIHVFSAQSAQPSNSLCATNRGSCPEVCLPTVDTFKVLCVCQDHSNYVNSNNSCVEVLDPGDITPPSFGNTCPKSLQIRLGECAQTAFFNFTPPVATDNSGKVIVKSYFHGVPPFQLQSGLHIFSYRAQDTNGNKAWCRFSAFVFSTPSCLENLSLPNGTMEGERSCESRYGSKVNITCSFDNSTVMEFQCGIDGNWELRRGPTACTNSSNKIPITVPNNQHHRLSAGDIAGIVLAALVGIAAAMMMVILSKKYCRIPFFKKPSSFSYIDRVHMKDGLKNIGSTITGALTHSEENPYSSMK